MTDGLTDDTMIKGAKNAYSVILSLHHVDAPSPHS